MASKRSLTIKLRKLNWALFTVFIDSSITAKSKTGFHFPDSTSESLKNISDCVIRSFSFSFLRTFPKISQINFCWFSGSLFLFLGRYALRYCSQVFNCLASTTFVHSVKRNWLVKWHSGFSCAAFSINIRISVSEAILHLPIFELYKRNAKSSSRWIEQHLDRNRK